MIFFKILRKFEIELNFFDYYRKFVAWYVVIKRFLIIFKTLNFKNSFNKNKFRLRWINEIRLKINELINSSKTNDRALIKRKKSIRIFVLNKKCLKAWKNLKKTLIDFSILAFSDFIKSFILYTNESKEWNFEMTIHQLNKNDVEKFILFFSKCLSDAKNNYWFTKLKTAVLIWTLIRFFQYFDDDFFTVVTNHFVLKTILQTNTIKKKSTRLNEWIMFLFIFLSKMTIVHRSKKFHLNADELFRFRFENKTISFLITIIIDEKKFLKKIIANFFKNKTFVKVMTKLKKFKKQTKNAENDSILKYQSYRWFDLKLFYFKIKFNFDRFCISETCQRRMLQYAHDEHVHVDIKRIYNFFFRSIFMSKIKKTITKYVIVCFQCQFSKSSKLTFYEKFQFIEMFSEFLTKLNLNFVVALSMIFEKSNVIFTIIDRFFKWIKIVSESKTMFVEKWKKLYW